MSQRDSREVGGSSSGGSSSFKEKLEQWAEVNDVQPEKYDRRDANTNGLASYKSETDAAKAIQRFWRSLEKAGLTRKDLLIQPWTEQKRTLLKRVLEHTRPDKKGGGEMYPVNWYARTEYGKFECDGVTGLDCPELVKATMHARLSGRGLRCTECQAKATKLGRLKDRTDTVRNRLFRKREEDLAEAERAARRRESVGKQAVYGEFLEGLESKLRALESLSTESGNWGDEDEKRLSKLGELQSSLDHAEYAFEAYLSDSDVAPDNLEVIAETTGMSLMDEVSFGVVEDALEGVISLKEELKKAGKAGA